MLIKQVSIFVENKEGKIAEILNVLGESQINIKALSLADTTNFGILRLIVNDPQKTIEILKEKDIIVKVNEVITVGVSDAPGELANILDILSNQKLSIEYMYAFIGDKDAKAMVVLKIDDIEKAINVLKKGNVTMISAEEIKQKWL